VYRSRKFVRRHRTVVGVVAVVLATIITGFVESHRQRVKAETERTNAELARDESEAARAESEAVTEFLADMLASVDPGEQGRDVTVREVLDEAAKTVRQDFAEQPRIEAHLRHTMGSTYRGLGEFESAEANLRRAIDVREEVLGDEHRETLEAKFDMAMLYFFADRHEESESLFRTTLESSRRVLGEEDPATLKSMNWVANALRRSGRIQEAESLFVVTLDRMRRVLGEEHPETMSCRKNLASVYGVADWKRGEELLSLTLENYEIARRAFGEEHPMTLGYLHDLASAYFGLTRHEEAESLFARALEIRRRVLGDDHPHTLASIVALSNVHRNQGRYAEAAAAMEEALEASRRVLGDDVFHNNRWARALGNIYQSQGRFSEAESLYKEYLQIFRRAQREKRTSTSNVLQRRTPDLFLELALARLYGRLGRYEEAVALAEANLEKRRRAWGELEKRGKVWDWHIPPTRVALQDLHRIYIAMGRPDLARPLFAEVLEMKKRAAEAPDAPPSVLSSYTWDLLTAEPVDLRDPEAALRFALRASERTRNGDAEILDTLALAYACNGDTAKAIESQSLAVEVARRGRRSDIEEFETRLAGYESALTNRQD
jgi:tetratricopeptide (TPR) repeat protein